MCSVSTSMRNHLETCLNEGRAHAVSWCPSACLLHKKQLTYRNLLLQLTDWCAKTQLGDLTATIKIIRNSMTD